MKNNVSMMGEKVIIYTTKNETIVVDSSVYYDFCLDEYYWFFNNNHVMGYHKDESRKTIYLHRLLMKALPRQKVRHLDNNKLNNLLENLTFERLGNEIEIFDDYSLVICQNGEKVIIDTEDIFRICKFTWWVDIEGYARTRGSGNTFLKMQRYIMNCNDENLVVDHLNGNTSDNRKENLRICSDQVNMSNRKIPRSNTSGTMGVNFCNRINLWVSRIGVKGKRIFLGSYVNYDDAVIARKKAEIKYNFISREK